MSLDENYGIITCKMPYIDDILKIIVWGVEMKNSDMRLNCENEHP